MASCFKIREADCFERQCKFYIGFGGKEQIEGEPFDESTERVVCEAFPDGIPDAIAYEGNPHTKPFPGDHGIQFIKGESTA